MRRVAHEDTGEVPHSKASGVNALPRGVPVAPASTLPLPKEFWVTAQALAPAQSKLARLPTAR